MKLYIAEKPSLGLTIAEGLGGGKKGNGHINGDDWCVTWCIGHLYELADPKVYNPKYEAWNVELLPIIPSQFVLVPKEGTEDQLKVVLRLIKAATIIVNCGDPDREGQLLVDEVITESGSNAPVKRAWLKDLSPDGVKKSLDNLDCNSKYIPLSESAKARSHADWISGINLTRAHTSLAKAIGYPSVLSVGRVQTPTLNLIAQRDIDIEKFKSIPFYEIQGVFEFDNQSIKAKYQIPNKLVGEGNKCIDLDVIKQVKKDLDELNKKATVKDVVLKQKSVLPPLPYELGTLQSESNKLFGYSAQETLDTAQSLYEEHKMTSYPRTDSGYLALGQLDECIDVINILLNEDNYKEYSENIHTNITPHCFNSSKVGAHTGIIPTGQLSKNLTEMEVNLFDLISRRFMSQFSSPFIYDETNVVINLENFEFKVNGKVIRDGGFKQILEPTKEQFPDTQKLPELTKSDELVVTSINIDEKKTSPPKPFTEATLIKTMMNISREFDDGAEKEMMKEVGGIGTSATRASIIETLKTRGFIEQKGKSLISTANARAFLKLITEEIRSPKMTAQWETEFGKIADGSLKYDEFMSNQETWIKTVIIDVLKTDMSALGGNKCPKCHTGYLVKRKSSYGVFVGCTEHPECTYIVPSKKSKKSKKKRGRKK